MKEEKIELTVAERIINITNECRIAKEGRNSFSNYDYFKPDDVFNVINPLLLKYNLFIQINMDWNKEDNKYIVEGIVSDASNTELKVTPYTLSMNEAKVKGENPAQYTGATFTYGKRYMYMNIFNIADNYADPDSDNMTIPQNKPKVEKPKVEKPKVVYTVDSAFTWIHENIGDMMRIRAEDDKSFDVPKAQDKMINALVDGSTSTDYLLDYYTNKRYKE